MTKPERLCLVTHMYSRHVHVWWIDETFFIFDTLYSPWFSAMNIVIQFNNSEKVLFSKCWTNAILILTILTKSFYSMLDKRCSYQNELESRADKIRPIDVETPFQWQEHVWDVYHSLVGLDQYVRATLNAVSWVELMAKHWRSRSMTSIFNTSCENPKMHIWCKFGDSSSNPI